MSKATLYNNDIDSDLYYYSHLTCTEQYTQKRRIVALLKLLKRADVYMISTKS